MAVQFTAIIRGGEEEVEVVGGEDFPPTSANVSAPNRDKSPGATAWAPDGCGRVNSKLNSESWILNREKSPEATAWVAELSKIWILNPESPILQPSNRGPSLILKSVIIISTAERCSYKRCSYIQEVLTENLNFESPIFQLSNRGTSCMAET